MRKPTKSSLGLLLESFTQQLSLPDLLVILVACANATTDIYMLCHSHSDTVFNIPGIQHAIGDTKKHLMFLHAVTCCHTVSAIYCKGKRKAFNVVHKKQDYDLLDTLTHEK